MNRDDVCILAIYPLMLQKYTISACFEDYTYTYLLNTQTILLFLCMTL